MTDGALIDGGSGLVDLTSADDTTLGGLLTSDTAAVNSTGGSIVDGGNAHLEVQATSAVLTAASGIGSADALETNLGTLAAHTAGGNLQIDNTAGGLLNIGSVLGWIGVSNLGAGSIRLTADDLNVSESILAVTGDIELFSSNATRTFALGSGPDVKSSGITIGTAAFGLDDAELDLITTTGVRRVIGGGGADQFNVNYTGNDTQPLSVLGLAGDDEFFVAPSATMPINLDGGAPSAPALPGDTLHLDMSGALPVVIVDTVGGFAISSNTAVVSFVEIETLELCDNSGDIDNADIGDLYVRSDNTRERITFTLWNDGGVKLRVYDLDTRVSTTFPQHFGLVGGVQLLQQLLVYAQDGDDLVSVAGHVVDSNGDPIPVEFHGEDGNDYLAGANGNDLLVGGPGNDRVLGGNGDNVMFGDGNEFVNGVLVELPTDGNDYLAGRGGDDSAWGGGGNDRTYGSSGDDVLNGGSGNDLIDGGQGTDILRGGLGDDRLSGSYGDDFLLGGDGDDQLFGRAGNDILIGGLNADRLRGGSDNDLLAAGTTAQDNDNDAALLAILAAWSGGVNNLTGNAADADVDLLIGDTGVDEFWADILPAPPTDSVVSQAGESVNDEP